MVDKGTTDPPPDAVAHSESEMLLKSVSQLNTEVQSIRSLLEAAAKHVAITAPNLKEDSSRALKAINQEGLFYDESTTVELLIKQVPPKNILQFASYYVTPLGQPPQEEREAPTDLMSGRKEVFKWNFPKNVDEEWAVGMSDVGYDTKGIFHRLDGSIYTFSKSPRHHIVR